MAYFAQLNTLKNTIFRLLAGLGGRRGVMMARLLFQLFVLDPLNVISARQAAPRCVNPPHVCLSRGELCYIGVYHGVLGHFWGQKITFPKSIGNCSVVVVEAGNRPEKPQKVIFKPQGCPTGGQAAPRPPASYPQKS